MSASRYLLRLMQGTARNDSSVLFQKPGVADRTPAMVTALRYALVSFDGL